jgi:hypothetical protein
MNWLNIALMALAWLIIVGTPVLIISLIIRRMLAASE